MTFKDYLEEVTPQYDEFFPVVPQKSMPWESDKDQQIIFNDDGDALVSSRSDKSVVYFIWNFNNKQRDKAHLIIDFYHNVNKANGRARSFKFLNPSEDPEVTYVVRFVGPLPGTVYAWGQHEIVSIKVLVEGIVSGTQVSEDSVFADSDADQFADSDTDQFAPRYSG
jgi:hypothetical protein